jgi:Flp pilus assembly protein TadD
MPSRFFRRVKIAPGVRVNFSKSLPSVSVGVRGAHVTVGHKRRRATVGIPGTGLFYTKYSHQHARAAGRGRPLTHTRTQGTPGPSVSDLFHKPPGAKIGYGLVFTVLVIGAPLGLPLLITGLVQLFSKRWRARALIAQASKDQNAEAAKAHLDQAAAKLPPNDPEVLAPLAAWNADQHNFAAAADLYGRYITSAQNDVAARGQYARCLLLSGHPDAAIAQFLKIRPVLMDVEGQASITTFLAIAQLTKGDANQALAILKEAPLQRHALGIGLQQCLQYRGVAQYFAGNTTRAVADLERLYAVNPLYPEIAEDKAAMLAGAFVLDGPLGPITRESLQRRQGGPDPQPPPISNAGSAETNMSNT